MATRQTLNIALLDADIPVPTVLGARGLYSTIFQGLLESALVRLAKANFIASNLLPQTHFSAYNVVRGEYPSNLASLDGIVISGSAASAYDSDPWITTLHTWLRHVHTNHPHLQIFGSCFGHQVLCSALLSPRRTPLSSPPPHPNSTGGGIVAKNPAGWEVGIHAVTLSPAFLRAFPVDALGLPSAPPCRHGPQMKLQFIHADHVVPPPAGGGGVELVSIGATPRCAVQGMYGGGGDGARVLTLQGHFEFDRFVNAETIKVFGAAWDGGVLGEAMKRVVEAGEDDAAWAAEFVMAFLMGLGRETEIVAETAVVENGLLTPPEEMDAVVV